MSEYIERGALLNLLADRMREYDVYDDFSDGKYSGFNDSFTMIEDTPAADVIVLPCKPGDTIYRVVRWGKRNVDIRERIVSAVEYNSAGEWVIHSTGEDVLGKKCFLTREEAERALSRAKMDGECREG